MKTTVLTMTKYSDPNDGITMTEWEFKEYVEAWVEKSLMIKQQKENDEQGSTSSPTENNNGSNLAS